MRITKKMWMGGLLVMLCIIASYAYRYFSPIYPFWVSEAKQKEIQEFYLDVAHAEKRFPYRVKIKEAFVLNEAERTILTQNYFRRSEEMQASDRLRETSGSIISHMLIVQPQESMALHAYQIVRQGDESRTFPVFVLVEKSNKEGCRHFYEAGSDIIMLARGYLHGDYVKLPKEKFPKRLRDRIPTRDFRYLGYSDYQHGFPKADDFADDAWPTIPCSYLLDASKHRYDFYVMRYFLDLQEKDILKQRMQQKNEMLKLQIEQSKIYMQD